MDMEKINADAARFSAKWAVDKQIDAERTERQAQEEAEWQAKPFYEKVYDKAPEVVDNIKEWGTAAWNSVGAVAQDVSDAYNEYGENRLKFMHEGANLQQAYQEAAESGDYSGLNKAVDNLRQAGRDYSVSIANFAVSPARQAARSFIRSNADDNSSPWQPLAQDLEKSDVAQEYFTTDAEKLQKAREIQAATGIPAEAALANNEAYKTALDVYNLKQKSDDIENVWEEYPELKNIARMDKDAAAIALHDIQSVRQSHGIVDNFMTFLEQGKKELEYNNLQYEILNGRATEEQKKRAESLKKEIDREKRQAPSMFDSPLEAAAAGVGQSLPEMVQGVKEAGAIDIGLTTLAVAATVLSGGTDLLAAGAVAGIRAAIMRTLAKEGTKNLLKAGTYYGMIHGMAAPESGSRYAQMGEEKKKDGTPLYTDEERANYALLGGYTNAALEIVPTLGVTKAVMFPVAERVFAQSAEQIVKRATQKESMQDFAMARLGDWFKLTATESAEEATQSVADDLITNYARESKGEEASHLKQYTAGEILNRAAVNFLESLPASAAFATAGVGVGTVTGAGRISRARKRAAQMENIYGQQQAQTMMGAMMVEQLQKSVKDSKMQKVAPDVQNKVLREQLKGTGYENAYIDVEMAMQKDNGREDLKKVAEAQGMSAEDLETAITSKGYISVPTETLSQVETSPDLLDSVSFTPEAESMARMRENGKKIIDEYNKNMQKAVDRQLKLAETIVDNYIPAENDEQHKAQREALKAVMLQNLQNPAQGWNELYKLYNAELQEKIGPALEALKRGMGNAGLLELPDEQGNIQTRRYTENDEWYRNWMKVHKNHKPTKAELEDMAIAMTIGDPSAPKVAGWIVDSAETQQAMERDKPIIENLKKNIDTLNSIKAEAKKMTGVEVELTEGLSPEAFKVYRAIAGWAEKAGGKIARAGRMTALLWARHADIVADIRTKKTGKKVTAEDYIRQRLLLQLEPDNGQTGEGLQQKQAERESITVKPKKFTGENGKEAMQNALEWFAKTYPKGTVVGTTVGDVHITKSGVKDSLAHGFSQKKLDVIPSLEKGLKQADFIKTLPDYENNQIQNHFFVYKVMIDGEKNFVLCRVREQDGYKKLYVHEVATAEQVQKKSDSLHAGEAASSLTPRGITLYTSILREYLDNVNKNVEEMPLDQLFQRAWHGTPHDFEKFDLGAIGSGEGAQAHGWGLYFAANREVSERYKDYLTEDSKYTVHGKKVGPFEDNLTKPEKRAVYVLETTGDKEKAIKHLQHAIEENKDDEAYVNIAKKALEYIENDEVKLSEDRGKLFEVEIPDNDVLLDEQKPFNEQPEKVRTAIIAATRVIDEEQEAITDNYDFISTSEGEKDTLEYAVKVLDEIEKILVTFRNDKESIIKKLKEYKRTTFEGVGGDFYADMINEKGLPAAILDIRKDKATYINDISDHQKEINELNNEIEDIIEKKIQEIKEEKDTGETQIIESEITGEQLYNRFEKIFHSPRKASQYLNKFGVEGITYEGGRDGRCFAIFDDKAIEIIEKYNQQVNTQQGKTLGWIDVKPNKDGQRTIHILETANESTFMHEMAHMFLFDLEELAEIDDISKKELDIVNDWAEWKKGAAKEYKGTDWYKNFAQLEQEIIDAEEHHDHETAEKKKAEWRQERFARGFELYMKEGTAPARGLKAVFRKFKSFLRAIYRKFTSDGGKPTEQVRRVMDRMIATEEEIDAAALEDRYTDVIKAGGEKLFNESEVETLKRFHEEVQAEAKEKVLKLVMKDLEKERQKEYDAKMAAEQERYTKQLQQENIFLARKIVEETKSKKDVTIFFDTVEEFEALDSITPSMDELVNQHMKEYGEKLDHEMMESHLSKEAIDKAMESSKYRVKIGEYIIKGMERKKALINKINAKARAAMESIEDKLNALPEDVDMQLEKNDNDTIKAIMKEITKLRFADKWSAADINHIEAMMRASTQEDVRKAIKDLKEKQAQEKQSLEDLENATKGMEEFFKEQIKRITATQPMTETCNVNYYLEKERNAGRRVKAMYRAKNWDGAINQQKNKVFYSMMVKQARENKEARDKMVKDLQRKLNAKTVRLPKDERYWFNHLLYIMRIARADVKVPEGGVAKLEDIFTEQKECLDIFYTPETLIRLRDEGDNFGDYNKLSLTEFRETYEDLKRLYTVGRDKFNLKTIRGVSIEEAVMEIINDVTANLNISTIMRKINPDTGGLNYIDALGTLGEPGDKLAKGVQKYVNSGLKVENILKMMGDKAYRYFYSTLERAAEQEAELTDRNLKKLRSICDMYTHEERQAWSDKKYEFSTEKGEKISKENIFAMALNWGTETNRQRLCGGLIEDGKLVGEKSAEQVGKEIEELFRKTMTEKDWQFIQRLWDLVGSYWHATAEVEEKLNGVALGRVENLPFEIETSDGKKIKLNGGYMHIKYNFEKSARAEEMEMEDMLNSMQAGAKRFGAGRSMTKSRSEYNIYRTLQLDFSVIEQHLQDVIHNIAFRVPLRDVYRLLHYKNNKTGASLEEHLRRTLGVAAYREIDNWALDAWKTISDERNTASGVLQNICRMWRSSSVFSIMAYRIWPVIENLSNVAVVADQLGAIGTMKAVGAFYRTPMEAKENLDFVRSMSAFMRTRMENIDRDLRNQSGTLHAGNKYIDIVKEHGYDLIVWSDLMCSAPTWLKSYKDAFQPKIEEVKKENDANMNKRLELAAKVDDLRAAIAAEEQAAAGIDDDLHIRRYGKPEEIEALRGGEYAGLSDGEMRAQWGEHKKKARELGKELFKAEQDLEQALQLPVYDDAEMLEEAKRRAVYAADSAIRNTFGSARNIDQPAVQRSKNELVRLFTAFYGFFNTQYNALYMSYMKSKYSDKSAITKWAPFARTAFYRVAMASFIGSVLAFGLGLQGDGKDEKEKTVTRPDGKKTKVEIPALERFLKVWAKNALSIGTGGLYGIRDIAQVIGDMYLTGNNFGFKMGSVATRSITEGIKAIQLFSRKDDKDEEIKAQQEKKEREHQEKLKKYKGKKRREYLQKWEEEQKYKKPPKRITYPEIAGHAAKSAGGVVGAKFGVTATMTNAITSTMDYLLDKDMRYDPTFKNIIWSALFDKKPIEREIPKKPPAEPKKSKKKKKEKN